MELLAQNNLVSYSAKKAKGLTEGLSYRRDFTTGQAVQMQQQSAYALFSGFFNLGQFLAFTGQGREQDAKQFAELLTEQLAIPDLRGAFRLPPEGTTKDGVYKDAFCRIERRGGSRSLRSRRLIEGAAWCSTGPSRPICSGNGSNRCAGSARHRQISPGFRRQPVYG